ncbi:MAG: hypothetical protein FWF50_01685 [Defluviitaleaceae bacterium]|nr:hypothetical protein [Defluviitaleaceae bacterium]
MYYNHQGQPIDIYGNIVPQFKPPYPHVVPPNAQLKQQEKWSLKPQSTQPNHSNSSVDNEPIQSFSIIDDTANLQEIGNKEARFGDTMFYYNPSNGMLFKKYVDFLTGIMHVETAQFQKTTDTQVSPTVVEVEDPRINELLQEVQQLKESSKPPQIEAVDTKSIVGIANETRSSTNQNK